MPIPTRTRSRSRRVAVALSALALSACSPGTPTTPPAPETESHGPVGPVPPGLDAFYGQSVTWGDCAPYATSSEAKAAFRVKGAQCAHLSVPLDYAKPDGDKIRLGLLRRKATKTDNRLGSLVINPGGPGASGMTAAAGLASRTKGELAERFDFVGFDPRGVGASEPQVKCLTDTERDAERADDLEADGSPEGVAKQEAEEKDFAAKCAQRTDKGTAMLANVGTRDVAKDMDILRSVLGDQKLTYLGYSYGTRIGSTYAETFPANVRALVLDGAVDPEQDAVESLVSQGRGFGKAFDEFAKWCAARQDCALGKDPANATKAYQDLTRPLIDFHVPVADGRKLSYEDATIGTIQALYGKDYWEPLNSALNELKLQRGETLMKLADMYNERDDQGKYQATQDVFTAVRCVDDPRVTDPETILKAQREYVKVAPFLDDGRPESAARDACAFWPVPNTMQPHQPKVDGLAPTLVISTTNDPATPYAAGVNLAKGLKGGLLTFEGTQHTVFLQGVSCVDKAGTDYLVNGTLPPEGTRCSGN
ncbi:alpha/beta hydrolase fold [Amycolatopsis xylanica]|uniref:Alpha/beta hydrolase fold n=1 Tax=Amycolatopsis xylanica TaxID=589385 RepID=A0A1H3SHS7_9PSEU|nr:alpha/beta hydrolase [Amycolatopsis xylanica]SDZ37522.1 alpha/beta hydrolase fold [Amycolatopsis xylanica]